ncbi:MAG: SsrA-binding protein SmpB [candidate division WOR-3 bacterium]|nr:SsrA-binding protein SmpB [candidate division WOR-3 bacterium]
MKVVSTNRKANHLYEITDTYEAGIVLKGSEVKSLRMGEVSLSDAYAEVKNGEVFLFNLHINPYRFSTIATPDPKRKRKLLLKKEEIKKLYGIVTQKGNLLIPLKIYFNDRGFAKVTIGVCRRKRLYDKKEKILREEAKKDLKRIKSINR